MILRRKRQNWEGKSVSNLIENQLSEIEMGCTAENHNGMCHLCTTGFLDSNFNSAVINKISNFHEIASNFTYSQKSYFKA